MKAITKLVLTALLAGMVSVSSGVAGSWAAAGDRINQRETNTLDIQTNDCHAVAYTYVAGSPGSPDDVSTFIATFNSSCNARVRHTYVNPGIPIVRYSTWRVVNGKNDTTTATLQNVYRCTTQLQVQRRDGSWFSVSTPRSTETSYCLR